MPGFFPHTSLQTSAYTPLLKSSFDALLSDIVADVGAGTNGWTLFDDQRSNTTALYPLPIGWIGFDHVYAPGYVAYYTFTQNSPTVTAYNGFGNYYRTDRNLISSSSINNNPAQITLDGGANYYTVTAVANTNLGFTLDRNWAPASVNTLGGIWAKMQGYIVLKCTSAQKSFYVQLMRPASHGDWLMVRTWESWNATTHVGTNSGPTETLRANANNVGQSGASSVRYVLWLLPDVFALWGGWSYSDFIYIGNLTPFVATDTDCLIQACTNQDYSGLICESGNQDSNGGAAMLRGIAGVTWNDPTQGTHSSNAYQYFPRWSGQCAYAIWPKGMTWMWNPWRAAFDNYGRFQITDAEVFSAEKASNISGNPGGYEGKRGDIKYLKYPLFNPSWFGLVQFGPADDGNTYVMIQTNWPSTGYGGSYASTGPNINQSSNTRTWNGFAHANKTYVSGEIGNPGGVFMMSPNFFLMPTNL